MSAARNAQIRKKTGNFRKPGSRAPILRHSGNNDVFERSKRIQWMDIDAVRRASALLIGAGALGNEAAKNLLLSGFENITIVDYDRIEVSNLNRCIYFSREDAEKKRAKATTLAVRLMAWGKSCGARISAKAAVADIIDMPEDFIPSHDIVLGCVDNLAARLHINAHCYHYRVPYIDGGTDGMVGKVQVIVPPKSACLECNMNETHARIVGERFSCTGRDYSKDAGAGEKDRRRRSKNEDGAVFIEEPLAAEITTTSVIAAIEVREAIKLLHKLKSPLENGIFYYDGMSGRAEIIKIRKDAKCQHHKYKNLKNRK